MVKFETLNLCVYLVPFSRELFVKSRNFSYPMYLAPPLGVTPIEFQQDLWHQKPSVPRLSTYNL